MAVPTWVDKWFSPQTIGVIIGFIIWLVQLNIGFVQMSETMARLENRSDESVKVMDKAVYILETMETRLEKAETRIDDHEKDANGWKHRIIRLENKLQIQ